MMTGSRRFAVRDRPDGANHTLTVEGELDLATVPVLANSVADRLGARPTNLTLDLSEVTFMDSSGLRLLIELSERARREHWELRLLPSRHEGANAVLRMTGADTALPFGTPPQS
jgi:anti-anti-sigma factor